MFTRALLIALLSVPTLAKTQAITVTTESRSSFVLLGADNIITCTVKGNPCSAIYLHPDNGTSIRSSGCQFIYKPDQTGEACISIFRTINGITQIIGEFGMQVVDLDRPIINIGGYPPGDTIPKAVFVAQAGLSCNSGHISNSLNPRCSVDSYTFWIMRDNEIVFISKESGSAFSKNIIKVLPELKPGDRISITNVIYIPPSGQRKKTDNFEYFIK